MENTSYNLKYKNGNIVNANDNDRMVLELDKNFTFESHFGADKYTFVNEEESYHLLDTLGDNSVLKRNYDDVEIYMSHEGETIDYVVVVFSSEDDDMLVSTLECYFEDDESDDDIQVLITKDGAIQLNAGEKLSRLMSHEPYAYEFYERYDGSTEENECVVFDGEKTFYRQPYDFNQITVIR